MGKDKRHPNLISVSVERVTLDTASNRFVVILKDDIYKRWLPIVVGPAEAQAIAIHMEKVTPPRPMTHDLIKNLLDSVRADINRLIITDLKDSTYYAVIDLKYNGSLAHIDTRPSDGIALALRMGSPILVDDEVMARAAIGEDVNMENSQYDTAEEINALNDKMQVAISEERYEDAAKFRDLINELKK